MRPPRGHGRADSFAENTVARCGFNALRRVPARVPPNMNAPVTEVARRIPRLAPATRGRKQFVNVNGHSDGPAALVRALGLRRTACSDDRRSVASLHQTL